MKKKYIYFAPPLVALVLFVAYYVHFRTGYDAQQEQIAITAQHEKEEAVRAQNEQRKKAVDEALASQERHRQEKKAREEFLAKRQEERQASLDARDKSFADLVKFRERVEKVTKDVATIKDEITKLEQDEELLRAQALFFRAYVEKAQVNDKSLTAVLDKIQKADDAHAAAVKAAATKKS